MPWTERGVCGRLRLQTCRLRSKSSVLMSGTTSGGVRTHRPTGRPVADAKCGKCSTTQWSTEHWPPMPRQPEWLSQSGTSKEEKARSSWTQDAAQLSLEVRGIFPFKSAWPSATDDGMRWSTKKFSDLGRESLSCPPRLTSTP
jgi:hypothetical protein